MAEFERRADWVWRQRELGSLPFGTSTPRTAEEANRYVYFRKTFELGELPTQAPVFASADGRYQLYVNGRLVGRGPARCSPAWQSMDRYELRPYLHPGRNVVAALVHSYGRNTAWYELPSWEHARAFGCGGFFLQGDVLRADGDVTVLDTDTSWRYLESSAWEREAPSGSLGFLEIYDARRAPAGWIEVEFNDSSWNTAQVLRVPGFNGSSDVVPFPVMVPRKIPQLVEEDGYPRRIVVVGEVTTAEGSEIASLFAQEILEEPATCRALNLEALISREGTCRVQTTRPRSLSVVLDFGETVVGRIFLKLLASEGSIVDFTYGERLEKDGRVHLHRGIPGFDVRPAHRLVLREGEQTFESFELAGFRYLQLTIRQAASPLEIKSVKVKKSVYPVKPQGSFDCSDPLLTLLWQTGRNTVHLCMQDGYIDCPSREQRQWLDGYLHALVNYVAFGDALLIANLLRQIGQSQRPDGITMMAAPGDFAASSFTNIPEFCLYWILAIGEYIKHVGDPTLVTELYPSVVKAVGWFERFVNHEKLLTSLPHWLFVDWAELDKRGQVTAINAQFVAALRVAASLARLAGCSGDARRFGRLSREVRAAINLHLWDGKRGVYVDARNRGVKSRRVSQQSNAAAIAFEVAPQKRWPRILATILDEKRLVLTRTGASDPNPPGLFDEESKVALAQPFYSHFLHRALSKAGFHQALLDNIRLRWGQMVAGGETTFWETWQLNPITSKCHGWSSTPTYDLSTEVLGITPSAPGFAEIQVAPRPVDLSWAKGVYPTPHGNVEIDWYRRDDRLEVSLTTPQRARFVLPEGWERLEVDGVLVGDGSAVLEPGSYQIAAQHHQRKRP